MARLLHIDASPLGERSISRSLTAQYVKHWTERNPGGSVIVRDLSTTPNSPIDAEFIRIINMPAEQRTAAERAALAFSDELIAELRAADSYVFGVPMHNFSVPAVLKLWIDRIVRAGETFRYGERGPVGLLSGKSAVVIAVSGGVYGPEAALHSMDFVQPYLRTLLGFIGVTDVEFIAAGGASAVTGGRIDRDTFLEPHRAAIGARFAA